MWIFISGFMDKTPYLDPGSGSFLLQLLIAGIAGLGIFIGAQWSKVKALLTGKKAKRDVDDNDDEQD
ncbi:MAG: hypothetical protein ACUVRJ_04390 [Candidatus Villigracilaceae bacterium]